MLAAATAGVGLLAVFSAGVGFVFAGSPDRLAAGVQIAGVDVGGLAPSEARARLEARSAELRRVPVTFVAGTQRWRVTPHQLDIEAGWAAAVDAARREGDGFGPLRGLRRLQTRFFGADVAPPVQVFEPALRYQVSRIAADVEGKPREAALRLRGLQPELVPAESGRTLERAAAEQIVVRALAAFARSPVALPLRLSQPNVTTQELRPVLAQVRRAVSAPVRLVHGPTRWRLPRWRVAQLLQLPDSGRTALRIGGPGARRYFARLNRRVGRDPVDATFAISAGRVKVEPSRAGLVVDVSATSAALLAAALEPTARLARLALAPVTPERTTTEAKAMGITRYVGGYTTTYGGEPNRLHNVRLVAGLIDGALIAPGVTFSFNGTTGERTAEKGFREAPVIINGELQTGLGGGVCQVSTTVFNAAYEAGLPIVTRTNHALYIDHYPLGRDATVNYPDLDLKFRNDTKKWLLLRTFVGSSSLTVNLYGAPLTRRVETEESPLVELRAPHEERVSDPSLFAGSRVVEDWGEPSRSTSVRRLVYDANDKLLYDTSWSSYYRAEPTIVRVGTKPRPKAEAKPEKQKSDAKDAAKEKTTPVPGEEAVPPEAATSPS